jgi:ABC-type transport system substrate-binding protein
VGRGRRASIALGLCGALAIGACSGSSGNAPTSTTDSSTTTAANTPVHGGTLRIGIERPASASVDPAAAQPTVEGEMVLADLLYDPLPLLSSSATPSADLKTWTFALRPGAAFSSGSPITADDVKYSLERVAAQGDASLAGARLDVVSAFKALDPSTIEVDLGAPFADLPALLSNPVYGIVPAAGSPSGSPPVGSGPFSVSSGSFAGSSVVHLTAAASAGAYLDGIDVHLFSTTADAYAAFEAGDVDWSPVPVASVADAAAAHGRAGFAPFQAEVFYAFNLANPKYADVRFRQAIMKAVDPTAVAASYSGRASPLHAVVPVGVPGHVYDPCGAPCAHDPAGARALLAAAFPFGPTTIPTVVLDHAEGSTDDAVAAAIERDLVAVGIHVQRRPHPFAEYETFASSGQQELFEFGWVGGYPTQDAYLYPLFQSTSRDNATGFSDPAVDLMLAGARAEPDAARRAAAYAATETAILGAAPIIPVAQFGTRTVVAPDVHDLVLALDGTFDATKVWLSGG